MSNHATLLSEDFLTVLHTCDSIQDLEAILEALKDEITILQNKDNQSSNDCLLENFIFQTFLANTQNEIKMLENVMKVIKRRMQRLASRETIASTNSVRVFFEIYPSLI